jgi:hypothetical protein
MFASLGRLDSADHRHATGTGDEPQLCVSTLGFAIMLSLLVVILLTSIIGGVLYMYRNGQQQLRFDKS